MGQAPGAVVLVRPHHFVPNPATISDNLFQARSPVPPSRALADAAFAEVTAVADALRAVGVGVHLFDDESTGTPDSVFPNNWFSTHPDGRVAIYPLYAPNRRAERRADIVRSLRVGFQVNGVHDYSVLEDDCLYLEGTGSMVLDHVQRVAYVARSFRSHDRAVAMVCRDLGYEPVVFSSLDSRGAPIYHTNVMMSVGSTVALVALDSFEHRAERDAVERRLAASGRVVVPLTQPQVDEFAGNTIELRGGDDSYLLLSARAHDSLTGEQRAVLSAHLKLLPVAVPTIELAGGSVRCMVAGIHLPRRVRRPAETGLVVLR
ncbi:citrulline utilization hydrolase CtlX [Cryptosporangium japonicum]|uniref:Arginine deiminase-related protein n=1 Tax=Cryptosporangium japonicum TaxID=80872 RepID=A0ABN0U1J9_9ACTN